MVFIVFLTESTVGHVFTDLAHCIKFRASGNRHHRVEIWSNGKLKGVHYN